MAYCLTDLTTERQQNNTNCHFFYHKIVLIFDSSVHNRITRQMNMLHLPRIRTDFGKNSFYCHGSVIFNSLNFQCFNILFMFTVTVYKSVF